MSNLRSEFKPTWLYVKRHRVTGLLYFGKTTKDPYSYNGSGLYWKKHCNKHGWGFVETLSVRLFKKEKAIVKAALAFSRKHRIVDSRNPDGSKTWANMVDENGLDGGHPVGSYSEASRKKMSANHSGRKIFNDGTREYKLRLDDPRVASLTRGQLESHRESTSVTHSGAKRSKETCKRISDAKRGVTLNLSDEQREAISERSRGPNNGMFGKTHTEKVKRKLAKLAKAQMLENNPMHRPEVAAKISARMTGSGNHAYGKTWYNDGVRNYYVFPDDAVSRKLKAGMMPRAYWFNDGKRSYKFNSPQDSRIRGLGLRKGKL